MKSAHIAVVRRSM